MNISRGEGVIHHQPVPALWQQPLHVQLQLGARVSLEVPHTGGALRVGATESHRTAGHQLLITVTVLKEENKKQTRRVRTKLCLCGNCFGVNLTKICVSVVENNCPSWYRYCGR